MNNKYQNTNAKQIFTAKLYEQSLQHWVMMLGLLLAVFFGQALMTKAAVYTVDTTAANAALTACTAAADDCSIGGAIANANANGQADTINFDATVFSTAQTINLNDGFTILADGKLTINGPAAGVTLSLANSNLPMRRSFSLFDANANLEIGNLTLTGGQTFQGGGIYSQAAVTVNNSIITGNSSTEVGGGIATSGGTLTVTNSIVSNNSASLIGGGIRNSFNATLTLTNSIVSGNSAGRFGGGGIANSTDSITTVTNSTISNNSGTGNGGGGILNGRATLSVINSTVRDNSIGGNGSGGGIASFNGSTLTMINSTVSGNFSNVGGGGIFQRTGTTTVTNSTVSGNSSNLRGGGIIILTPGILTLTNTTVSSNSAGIEGGGIYREGGQLNAGNSIFADNNAPAAADFFGSVISQGYNLFETPPTTGGYLPNDLVGVDPMLGALQNNGGLTETHALLPGSPAIDKGNSFGTTTDQRGFARPVDFPLPNAPGGGGSDIGAFEAGKEQCKNGGWMVLGNGTFRNQGQCVSFVNTGR